jgi:hypothetical protein
VLAAVLANKDEVAVPAVKALVATFDVSAVIACEALSDNKT